MGTIAFQQRGQTAPRVGSSRGARHAAQAGARTTATTPSTRRKTKEGRRKYFFLLSSGFFLGVSRLVRDVDPFGVTPEPFERIEVARLRRKNMDDEREEVH